MIKNRGLYFNIRKLRTTAMNFRDSVFIKKISATAITGKDAWNRPTPQPINISVDLKTDFSDASNKDNLKYSLNYAVISRHIFDFMKANETRNFTSLGNIAESISEIVLDPKKGGGEYAEVVVSSEKSEIRADSVEYKLIRTNTGSNIPDKVNILGLKLLTLIGVFTFERLQKQFVEIDLSVQLKSKKTLLIHSLINDLTTYVESSNFKTVEALIKKIGQLALQNYGNSIERIEIKITKPNAIPYTEGVGVFSEMDGSSFQGVSPISNTLIENAKGFNLPTSEEDSRFDIQSESTAYIAFGSNVGNQIQNINSAIKLLDENDINVCSTSSLYISKPMYYKDQQDFYNGVLKVKFQGKSPMDLLRILKEIEYDNMGRVKRMENGPRVIDLDILLIDDLILNTPELTVPHKSMLERSFVLKPLCELLEPSILHPVSAEPIHDHLRQLNNSNGNVDLQESGNLLQVVPLQSISGIERHLIFDEDNGTKQTMIMGILNVTPDSFSDAGKNYEKSIPEILTEVETILANGANIIDIGGMSTRPGSVEVSEEEELRRVLPVIKAIRSSDNSIVSQCIISVDTYNAIVAEESLKAGADIINDISTGRFDDRLFSVISKYGCPYIISHSRGTPQNMSKLITYNANTNDDLIEYLHDRKTARSISFDSPQVENLITGVSRELALQINKAFAAGVKKWQIILDPGIGFAKDSKQNLALIRHTSIIKEYAISISSTAQDPLNQRYISFYGLPILVGTSRKKFLGTLTNETCPEKRVTSTAATIVASIEQKADIVRVHDVKEMKKACTIADAIYKNIP